MGWTELMLVFLLGFFIVHLIVTVNGRCERQFHGSCGELGFLGKGGTG